jgi:hypothetical protein
MNAPWTQAESKTFKVDVPVRGLSWRWPETWLVGAILSAGFGAGLFAWIQLLD